MIELTITTRILLNGDEQELADELGRTFVAASADFMRSLGYNDLAAFTVDYKTKKVVEVPL